MLLQPVFEILREWGPGAFGFLCRLFRLLSNAARKRSTQGEDGFGLRLEPGFVYVANRQGPDQPPSRVNLTGDFAVLGLVLLDGNACGSGRGVFGGEPGFEDLNPLAVFVPPTE